MEESVFPVELLPPDEDGEWEARSVGHVSYGDTAEEAMSNLGVQLDALVEDAEYNRIHAPGGYIADDRTDAGKRSQG